MTKQVERDLGTLLSAPEIKRGVADVIKATATVAERIHFWAIQGLLHAEKHGDPVYVGRLADGMHAMARPQAFIVWLTKYSPVRKNDKTNAWGLMKKDSKAFVDFNITAAMSDPYWTKAENVGKALTLKALLAMCVQAATKAEKEDKYFAEGENIVLIRNFAEKVRGVITAIEGQSTAAAAPATGIMGASIPSATPVEEVVGEAMPEVKAA